MKRDRFIVILGWMMDDLGLSGNDLLIYALIYGFSQDGKNEYTGSLAKLAEWIHTSDSRCSERLARLVERGLLNKRVFEMNGVTRCGYMAVPPHTPPRNGGGTETGEIPPRNGGGTLPRNGVQPYIKDNNKDINKSNQSIAGARTREEEVADLKKEFRAKADAVAGTTYTKEMMDAFCDYWTEPYTNPVGKKFVRWQGEKTWDMAARLRTWASRDKQFAAKARPAYERPKLRPAVDLTFDYAENQRLMHEIGKIRDGEDNGYDY